MKRVLVVLAMAVLVAGFGLGGYGLWHTVEAQNEFEQELEQMTTRLDALARSVEDEAERREAAAGEGITDEELVTAFTDVGEILGDLRRRLTTLTRSNDRVQDRLDALEGSLWDIESEVSAVCNDVRYMANAEGYFGFHCQ